MARPLAYLGVRQRVVALLADGGGAAGFGWVDPYAGHADDLLRVLERCPAEPFLLNACGVLLHELTRRDAAATLFRAALALDPELPAAAANLAAASAGGGPALDRPGLDALARRARTVAARARPAEGLTVSLCLVVRDEEELLPGCLASAADAVDELVVVDSGSTDGTVAIAESFGARVLHVPWSGSFSEARNAGLEQATGDWILMLDADERLAPGAAPALRALLGRTWREAFLLPLTSPTGPQTALRHPALRLWRNRPGYRFAGRVHEALAGLPTGLPERFELAPVGIEHLGYLPEHAAARGKTARNLALLELEPPGPARSFDLGSEYLRAGELERAAEHLDDAWLGICGDPGWPAVGFAPLLAARAARTRRELGRLEAARGLLGVALERLPDYTDLWFELAACATAAGDRAEAERLLERCLELGDAPLRYPATIGAGSRLARARLDEVRGG